MSGETLLAVIMGAVLGVVSALLLQPLLQDRAHRFLIRLFGPLAPTPKGSLAGSWASVWCLEDQELTRNREMTGIDLRELGGHLTGTFEWEGRKYRILAQRASDLFVTGRYEDLTSGRTFHGALQLVIHPGESHMSGKWIGFDADNSVLSGPWEWRRTNAEEYVFETRGSDPVPR